MHKKVKLGDKPGIIVTYDRETNILSVCLRDLYSSFPLSRVCVCVCVCWGMRGMGILKHLGRDTTKYYLAFLQNDDTF